MPKFFKLALLGLALLGAFFVVFGVYFVVYGHEAANWPSVEGTVSGTHVATDTSVSDVSRTNRISRRYYPVIHYEYSVAGELYTGSLYRFGEGDNPGSFKTKKEAQAAASAFPNGSALEVFYDPDEPSSAVRNNSASWALAGPILIGLLFLGSGIGGLKLGQLVDANPSQNHQDPKNRDSNYQGQEQ